RATPGGAADCRDRRMCGSGSPSSTPGPPVGRSRARGDRDQVRGRVRAIGATRHSRAARQKTTKHVCWDPARSVIIRTASMLLGTGNRTKKSIARLPGFTKSVEAVFFPSPTQKGETPLRRGGWGGSVQAQRSSRACEGNRDHPPSPPFVRGRAYKKPLPLI